MADICLECSFQQLALHVRDGLVAQDIAAVYASKEDAIARASNFLKSANEVRTDLIAKGRLLQQTTPQPSLAPESAQPATPAESVSTRGSRSEPKPLQPATPAETFAAVIPICGTGTRRSHTPAANAGHTTACSECPWSRQFPEGEPATSVVLQPLHSTACPCRRIPSRCCRTRSNSRAHSAGPDTGNAGRALATAGPTCGTATRRSHTPAANAGRTTPCRGFLWSQ